MDIRRSFRSLATASLGVLVAAGCSVPNFEGAQIQEPPPGFRIQNESYQQRRMFPELDITRHLAWINAGNGPYSGIYINGHAGTITVEDVVAAQEAGRANTPHPAVTFGDIEGITIDGRQGWGWAERLETPELGLDWVAYRAVVSYDTVFYSIEFYGGDPAIKLAAPDTLRAVIGTFAVGEVEWNWPIILVALGLGAFAVVTLRKRADAKKERLSSINLVKVEKKEEAEEEEAPGAPAAPRPPPPPPVSPTELRDPPTGGDG